MRMIAKLDNKKMKKKLDQIDRLVVVGFATQALQHIRNGHNRENCDCPRLCLLENEDFFLHVLTLAYNDASEE